MSSFDPFLLVSINVGFLNWLIPFLLLKTISSLWNNKSSIKNI